MLNEKVGGTTWYLQFPIIVYDLVPPLISNAEAVKEDNRQWHAMIDGLFGCKYEDIEVRMLGAK
jgi:hypothetical protein